MQPTSSASRPTRGAAHHQKRNVAKRPWHRHLLLCCFAGASKQDDVDDPYEPSAAPSEHSDQRGEPAAASAVTSSTVQAPATATAFSTAQPATSVVYPAPAATVAVAQPEANPPRAEGPITNLLDESVTDTSVPLFETNSGTANTCIAARDLNLGSPLMTPTTSHHALAVPPPATAAVGSREVTSAEDLDLGSTSRSMTGSGGRVQGGTAAVAGPDGGLPYNPSPAAAAAGAAAGEQQQQERSQSPFLNQQHQSSVTAQLMGMQMQQYRAQHPTAQQQQQPKSLEQQQVQEQQQQQQGVEAAKRLAPAGTPGAAAAAAAEAAADSSSAEPALPAVFSRNIAGWDSDRTAAVAAAAAGSTVVGAVAAAAAAAADANRIADLPELRVRTSTPGAVGLQQQHSDIYSRLDQQPKQYTADLPPRSPHTALKPLSVLVPETSADASPFEQQQQSPADRQSMSVVPMTAGMPPLSPLRIPSSNENSRNLLKLISHNGSLDPDLEDSPQSPRASVVGVSNSVINTLLSEDGIPLVPTEPGLEETLINPVPETLEATPGTPKRVRSFANLANLGGTSGRWAGNQVPETPRVSLSGTWSESRRDQLGQSVSPLRSGHVVRSFRGERRVMGGTSSGYPDGLRGGFVSDSNLIGGGYSGAAYRRRSTAGGSSSSSRDEVGSWDVGGPAGLRAASSSSKFPAAAAGSGRVRRGSSGMECSTPRAGHTSLSFSDGHRYRPSSNSNSLSYSRDPNNPKGAAAVAAVAAAAAERANGTFSNGPADGIIMLDAHTAADTSTKQAAAAATAADVDMSAPDMAAAASFHMSPPDDPNPSRQDNIVYSFEPSSTSVSTRRSSQMYRVGSPGYDSALVGEFSGGHGAGSSTSSAQAYSYSDRGLATNNLYGSGALFSRSGFTDLARKGEGLGGHDQAGSYGGVLGSPAAGRQGIVAPASLFATPVKKPVGQV